MTLWCNGCHYIFLDENHVLKVSYWRGKKKGTIPYNLLCIIKNWVPSGSLWIWSNPSDYRLAIPGWVISVLQAQHHRIGWCVAQKSNCVQRAYFYIKLHHTVYTQENSIHRVLSEGRGSKFLIISSLWKSWMVLWWSICDFKATIFSKTS